MLVIVIETILGDGGNRYAGGGRAGGDGGDDDHRISWDGGGDCGS